jgi:Fic family protein
MPYTPRFTLTTPMLEAMTTIGGYRSTVTLLPLSLATERRLRRETRVRVAHNSTWIENRTLALAEAAAIIADKTLQDPTRGKEQAAQEVRTYFQALEFIDLHADAVPDEDFICRLHAIIMRGSSGGRPRERSTYRNDNLRVGNFVYVPPAHEDVPVLMADLAAWATGPGQSLPRPLFAAVLAYQFVTIHPFHDGNGRTCRALATWALRGPEDTTAIDPLGLLNVEEFYAADLDGYYAALQMGCHFSYYDRNDHGSRSDPDLSPWIGYVLTMLARSAEQVGRSIAEWFRATHADLLSDPVAAWPRTFRRLVIHRADALAPFGPAEVADVLQVSDRTARTWLQSWHEAGLIVPQRPDAQRVHAWALAPAIATTIAREMAP